MNDESMGRMFLVALDHWSRAPERYRLAKRRMHVTSKLPEMTERARRKRKTKRKAARRARKRNRR